MQILVLVSGEYGQRSVRNLTTHAPLKWTINTWQPPHVLPRVIDHPEIYLPDILPPAHLILSLMESPSAANLIPTIARMTGAQAVIAPIDNQEWLSVEQAKILAARCAEIGITCISPMPFCSLTETTLNVDPYLTSYDHPLIRGFARHFGRPEFQIEVDEQTACITRIQVTRDTCCGCARHVARELAGSPLRKVGYRAERFHRCYACRATPRLDLHYGNTLLNVSGNLMEQAIRTGLGDYASKVPRR